MVQRTTGHDDIALLVEAHLDPLFESNVWHVRGRDRDMVVDTGNGIGDLRAELAPFVDERPIVAVATHDHFDHIGGLHAFEERWCHAADADGVRVPDGLALMRQDFRRGLDDEIRWYGYEPPELVITALPWKGFDVADGGHPSRSRRGSSAKGPRGSGGSRLRGPAPPGTHARVDRPLGCR